MHESICLLIILEFIQGNQLNTASVLSTVSVIPLMMSVVHKCYVEPSNNKRVRVVSSM